MDNLSIELLEHICRFVQESSPQDLRSLSSVNRSFYHVSLPLLYNTLTLKLRSDITVKNYVSKYQATELQRYYSKYTRELNLICSQPARPGAPSPDGPPSSDLYGHIPPGAVASWSSCFLEPQLTGHSTREITWSDYFNNGDDDITDWEPLVALIAGFQRLVELNYGLRSQFPPALYQAITNYHPNCVLNIWSFMSLRDQINYRRMRVYGNFGDEPPFEQSTLSLVGLRSLAFDALEQCYPRTTQHGAWKTAVLPFLTIPSKLKHLVVRRLIIYGRDQEWQVPQQRPKPLVALDSLTFCDSGAWETLLPPLGQIFDLSALKSLDISVMLDPTPLKAIAPHLNSLESLYFTLSLRDAEENVAITEDDDRMIDLLQHFNSIKFLCLRYIRQSLSLRRILSHHGPSLNGLAIEPSYKNSRLMVAKPDHGYKYPILDEGDILWIAEHCPHLSELRVQTQRSQGSAEECRMYRALGKLNSLRTLVLDLQCDPRPLSKSKNYPMTTEEARIALLNAAVDKNLATAIWNMIVANQESRNLQNLRCTAFGGKSIPDDQGLVARIARSYLVRRSMGSGGLDISYSGDPAMERPKRQDGSDHSGGRPSHPLKVLNRVVPELWPEGAAWDDEWRSLPLQA